MHWNRSRRFSVYTPSMEIKNEKRVLLLSLMLSSRLTGEIFYMVDLRSLPLVEMTETVVVYEMTETVVVYEMTETVVVYEMTETVVVYEMTERW